MFIVVSKKEKNENNERKEYTQDWDLFLGIGNHLFLFLSDIFFIILCFSGANWCRSDVCSSINL